MKRVQNQRIQHAEDNGIGADGQRQSQHGSQGKSRRFSQLS